MAEISATLKDVGMVVPIVALFNLQFCSCRNQTDPGDYC